MDQEEKKEQAEEVETEEKEQPAAEETAKPVKPAKTNLTPYLLIAAALVIGIMRDMLNEKGFDIPADVQDIDALADYIAKQVKSHA